MVSTRWILVLGLCGLPLLQGCGTAPSLAQDQAPVTAPKPVAKPVAIVRGDETRDFVTWRKGFRARALAAGISADVFDAAFDGVGINPRVIELDRYQPEFRRQIWDYLDRAVSDARIANGQARLAENRALLAAIEGRYGVDARVIVAIWGLESAYGATKGDMNVITSLATLAVEGRRREFAESQLLTALRILQSGDTTAQGLVGSWAGAMGHTQFIPTSYAEYAQDWTGDGRRDIWGADPSDALASTANYLAKFGWTKGAPWGVEVALPAGFDPGLADGDTWRAVADWRARGVTAVDGGALPDFGQAAILAPAGRQGPAFAVFNNFKVIKRYNNANSYALAVGHLGDRIMGGGGFVADWPRDEQALTLRETTELQERLTALGHDTGGTDGLVGPNTIAAIRDFQRTRGLAPDGFPTKTLLAALRKAGNG